MTSLHFIYEHFYDIITWIDQTNDSISSQIEAWIWNVVYTLFMWAMSTRVWGSLWSLLTTTLYVIFIVPIVFYSFYKSVYDFGPKNRKRTFVQIWRDPTPPESEYEWDDKRWEGNEFFSRDNPNIIPRRVMRRAKRYLSKEDRKAEAKHRQRAFKDERRFIHRVVQYKCPVGVITPLAERHNIHSMYTNPHAGSMGYDNAYVNTEMAKTLYFIVNAFSYPYWVYIKPPKKPPDGIITHVIMSSMITGIFAIIVSRAYVRLRFYILLCNTRRRLQHMAASKSFGLCKRAFHACIPSQFMLPLRLNSLNIFSK